MCVKDARNEGILGTHFSEWAAFHFGIRKFRTSVADDLAPSAINQRFPRVGDTFIVAPHESSRFEMPLADNRPNGSRKTHCYMFAILNSLFTQIGPIKSIFQ